MSLCVQVEFVGEEGTGLGPSLEFYALVAAELQGRSIGLWLCDDDFPDDQTREVGGGGCVCVCGVVWCGCAEIMALIG